MRKQPSKFRSKKHHSRRSLDKWGFLTLLALALLAGILLTACGSPAVEPAAQQALEAPSAPASPVAAVEEPTPAPRELRPAPGEMATTPMDPRVLAALRQAVSNLGPAEPGAVATAHARYLQDPLEFQDLPNPGFTGDSFVVGSRQARFWPVTEVPAEGTTPQLGEGIPLELGLFLPNQGQISAEDINYEGMYNFEDHLNWFYRTEYQGQAGVVFGADLSGLNRSLDHNTVRSLYYQTGGRFDRFYPINGFEGLSSTRQESLETERLILMEVDPRTYPLSLENPDDLIALYRQAAQDRQRPLFVTTDLFAQGIHLFFGKFLQHVEEFVFVPRLATLVDSYLEALQAREESPEVQALDSGHPFRRALERTRNYLLIPQALLRLAPQRMEQVNERGRGPTEIVYEAPSAAERLTLLAEYPQNVRDEIEMIDGAEGFEVSPNFLYREDYSQYRPRGHYTKNGVLEAYFRAMMFFGRIHIHISTGTNNLIPPLPASLEIDERNPANNTALGVSVQLAPMAFILADITQENPELQDTWSSLFDPITHMIGMSDDLSYYEILPFWEAAGVEDWPAFLADPANVVEQINRAHRELRPPQIAGNSVFLAPSEGEDRNPPMGWRLFGQRFTWDSYVHHNLSSPRLYGRLLVTGLDVMSVFGSRSARAFLEPEVQAWAERGLDFGGKLETLRAEFAGFGPDFWANSYYNRTLAMIRDQARFEPGTGLYFTESPAWAVKAQLSAHGTWATLRHDTILYVKQSYSELAGGGGWQPSFRTLPLPVPRHMVEPNLPFFASSLGAVLDLAQAANEYSLANEAFNLKIRGWQDLLTRTARIARLQWDNQELSDEDNLWIPTIPSLMAPLVLPPEGGAYTDDPDSLKGALVADVFTSVETEQVLEVATGVPLRMFVPLNDVGGKRIAQGFTFNYYEFYHPMSDRLTNEQWRPRVYSEDPTLAELRPAWAQGVVQPRDR